jgi:hypothetical protein
MNVNNYFDMQQLVNEVVGSTGLFIILGIIAIVWFSMKNNVPFQVQIILVGLWISAMWAVYASPFYVFLVVAAGLVAYAAVRKYMF